MQLKAPFSTVSFLDIPIHQATQEGVSLWMEACIADRKPRFLCTLNAALLVWSEKDPFLKAAYQNADLATCDSMVVYYALKLLGKGVPESLEACQIMFKFIKRNHKKNYRYYFLGATPEIAQKAVEELTLQYPQINIVGYHHGYFKQDEEKDLVAAIKQAKPDCLFIGTSSPLKERFITQYKEEMGVPVCLGVGGGLDILAGKYRLAPLWMRKMGLAWLYRLILEPRRMWRRYLTTNTIFLWIFFKNWAKRGTL